MAAWQLDRRADYSGSLIWALYEYLGLFALVLMHEFGHSLACRQVGGTAREIILWPLGGVAFVTPPPRPGPILWSIAAGPLVNLVLVPVFIGLLALGRSLGWPMEAPFTYALLDRLQDINYVLLIFNMLPIYPLDGGQILHALLWFPLGRAKSLMVASAIGLLGAAGFLLYALYVGQIWLGLIAAFAVSRSWNGWQEARARARAESWPRHQDFHCPSCRMSPPKAALWICGECQEPFDTFEHNGACPACVREFAGTSCPDCGHASPFEQWKH